MWPKWYAFGFDHDRNSIQHSGHKNIGRTIIVTNDVVMDQSRCRVPDIVRAKHSDLAISEGEIITAEVASVEATMQDDRPCDESGKNITKHIGCSADFKWLRTRQPTNVLHSVGVQHV